MWVFIIYRYFCSNEALQLSPGMDQLGGVRGDLVGYMALSYLAIFLFICKGKY